MSKLSTTIRTLIITALVIVLAFLCVVQLLRIQIVDGEKYAAQTSKTYTATQSIQAARGQIVDSKGQVMTTNAIVYKVIIQKAFLTSGSENKIIGKTLAIFEKNGEEWIDSVPITQTEPFKFTTSDEAVIDKFKTNLGLNLDATVENCVAALSRKFEIDESYNAHQKRIIAGVRYEMLIRDFSFDNRYTMAEDISLDTVIELKEQSFLLSGIDIIEEPMRVYVRSSTAPHVLGTVGAISAEQYETLKGDGYGLNDEIGKSGIEKAMESVLRGVNGVRTIVRDSSGNAVADEVTQNVQTGNSVKLTIDSEFQETVQQILENHINWLHYYDDPTRGNLCDAGSVVVLDVKTGAVLAMVNYPTYDLNEYIDDYEKVINTPGGPVYNRATTGLYRPGSAFKTVTASAGLIEGIIDNKSRITCNSVYNYYKDITFKCTGTHGSITVVDALKWSCNIFFYEVGRKLGIDTLSNYAAQFGIGTDLGLEIGGASGRMTTPEIYEEVVGEEWTEGNTIQTAIGQSETLVTPLNLAVVAMTLANNGVRYKPYLVDSVMNYDCTQTLYKTQPTIVQTIDDNETNAFDTVRQGMIEVSKNCTWPIGMTTWHFDYLPYNVAIKTGTPQVTTTTYNSTVLGFYPAEDPQIAFGIVLEKGEFSRYMVRNLIDAYFYNCYEPELDEDGNVISPWKRWTEEEAAIRTHSDTAEPAA